MIDLIIMGTGGHAGVVIESIRPQGTYRIEGLLDDFLPVGEMRHGYKVVGRIEDAPKFIGCQFFIAIGDNQARRRIFEYGCLTSDQYAPVIDLSAQVAITAKIRAGVFIGPGANVGNDSTVFSFSIVNTHASLDHDSELGEFSHMAPGSTTGGRVTIGPDTFIGINACIRDGIQIGRFSTIGMGSVVTKNVEMMSRGWGVPWRPQEMDSPVRPATFNPS